MRPDSQNTPAQVILEGFPPGAVRVVASRQQGDAAYVLLDTRPEGPSYLYGVNCERVDGQWAEGSSGNGGGWSRIGPDDERGTLTLWDDILPGADRVRARFADKLYEEAVEHGAFLFVWWNVLCPDEGWPRLEALRIDGEWQPPPSPFWLRPTVRPNER